MARALVFLALLGLAAAGKPDCSKSVCSSECNCVEQKCGADKVNECTGDSQCNEIIGCLDKCPCGQLSCAVKCIAGKSLTKASKDVEKCAMPCKGMAADAPSDPKQDREWAQFKQKYKKVYTDDVDERSRYKLYLATIERVATLNAQNGQPAFGITWMADRYESEKYKRGHKKPAGFKPTAPVMEFNADEIRSPKSIDWKLTEAVTPIKNQGQCGSCWAFSATEATESALILAGGSKYAIDLSPQQITSCAPPTGQYGCQGCNGGFTEGAYEYLKTVPGLANSFYIPYEQSLTQQSATAACPTAKVQQISGPMEQLSGGFAQVTGYSYAVPPCTQGACQNQDLKGFAAALEKHPLSICVNAGSWNDYTGGVLTAQGCGSMAADAQDHCVMATGFNTTAPTPYWIVRNSWASTWGEMGYIYLEMAKNTCGLADDATFPKVSLDLTEQEEIEAAVSREDMYQRATRFESREKKVVV